MDKILDSKNYFCINCFENENIRKLIREYGKEIKLKYNCNFCQFETCNEFDIEDCIQEYIQIVNSFLIISGLKYLIKIIKIPRIINQMNLNQNIE